MATMRALGLQRSSFSSKPLSTQNTPNVQGNDFGPPAPPSPPSPQVASSPPAPSSSPPQVVIDDTGKKCTDIMFFLGPWSVVVRSTIKHSVKETPVETWKKCNDVVERHDERMCNVIKEISFLMVVAGLHLAVVTAFTVKSYKLLQEDKQDTMTDLLVEVVRLLNDTSVRGHAGLPKPFTPDHRHVVVNQLWFLSIILSLVAVMIGTFCLQWISAFLRAAEPNKSVPPEESLAMRQLRYEGMVGWGVRRAPEALLLIVQLSIALFTLGLVYFLWGVSHTATIPALTAAALAGILLYLANLMPFLQSLVAVFFPKTLTLPQCPYKSPTSWLIQSICSLLALVFNSESFQILFQGDHATHSIVAGRFSEWLKKLPRPFTDYLWEKHDSMCADLRDSQDARSRASYRGHGLSSAIDILVLEQDAVNLICNSMQSLATDFRDAEIWKDTFDQDLKQTELDMIQRGSKLYCFCPYFPRTRKSKLDLDTFLNSIRHDFLYALLLQNLVRRSKQPELKSILLPHRIELYIRIANSGLFIQNSTDPPPVPDSQHHEFGNSVTFPLDHRSEILYLDRDLQFQLLKCINRLTRANCAQELHFVVAAIIIREASYADTQLSTGDATAGVVEAEQDPTDPGAHESDAYRKQVDASRLTASFHHLTNRMMQELLMIPLWYFNNQNIHYAMHQILTNPQIEWDEVMDRLGPGPLHELVDGVDLAVQIQPDGT